MAEVEGRKRGRRMPDISNKERKKMFWEDDSGWRDVTPSDSMALLVGSDEGGFMSLEEIDGEVCDGASGLDLETVAGEDHGSQEGKKTSKKRKKVEANNVVEDLVRTKNVARARKLAKTCKFPPAVEQEAGEEGSRIATAGSRVEEVCGPKEGPPAGKRSRKGVNVVEDTPEDTPELHFDLSAWAHLRLHPLLQKAIALMGFKEPTPIQNACIPAAAHQGKDVIGAAETGSGKTLAFGIPILQRLLEEQEKARRQDVDGVEAGNSRSGFLRALIIAPTRELAMQVSDHLKAVAKFTNLRVVPIVGGMSTQKQARLLAQKPDIVVGTPGRLWELMSEGESHLLDLRALSFFVLDEADRMVEKGHFQELQSIIDLVPKADKLGRKERKEAETSEAQVGETEMDNGAEEDALHIGAPNEAAFKRRQTMVFSATLALPENFRKKLKRGFQAPTGNESSLSALSERAGVRHTAAIVDLTSKTVMAQHLEESVVECRDDEKDAFLYYVLKVHGSGRTIVFCTSIAAVRRVSAILRLLQLPMWALHAQMQQRQRLKAMDRFRDSDHGILVATDVAARGLDIPGIRTVIHYQLPHSAEIYVHRSGRTARAQTDGCSITFVSPSDQRKYAALCKSLSKKDGLTAFPINSDYMPGVERRVSLAVQIDKLSRKVAQGQDRKSWLARNAEALELDLEEVDEDGGDHKGKTGKDHAELKKLQQELDVMLKQPLQPKSFSRRYVAGVGMSPLVATQLQQVVGVKGNLVSNARASFVVIGQEAMEPLQAFRKSVEAVEGGESKPQRSLVKPNSRKSKPQRSTVKSKKQRQGKR